MYYLTVPNCYARLETMNYYSSSSLRCIYPSKDIIQAFHFSYDDVHIHWCILINVYYNIAWWLIQLVHTIGTYDAFIGEVAYSVGTGLSMESILCLVFQVWTATLSYQFKDLTKHYFLVKPCGNIRDKCLHPRSIDKFRPFILSWLTAALSIAQVQPNTMHPLAVATTVLWQPLLLSILAFHFSQSATLER